MADELITTSSFRPVRVAGDDSRHESVEQILYIFFRRKRLIFGLFLAFTLAAAFAVWSKPPVRSASAKVLLKSDRVSLQISQLSPASARVPYSMEALESEMELMKSRNVLLPVAERILTEESKGATPDKTAIEALTTKLGKNLETNTIRQASVIELEYFSTTAEEAERILAMIVDQYLEEHAVAYSGSTQLLTFYEKEKERAAKALEEAENRFQSWQTSENVVAIDAQIQNLLEERSTLEREIASNQAGMQVTIGTNELLGRLQGSLVTAEVELADLRARYTDQDRRVQEAIAKVALFQGQIEGARRSVQSSLSARQSSLTAKSAQISAALDGLRRQKLEGERLTRTVDVAREAFLLYGKKLEEARISHQLGREQLSNVALVEQPHAPRDQR